MSASTHYWAFAWSSLLGRCRDLASCPVRAHPLPG